MLTHDLIELPPTAQAHEPTVQDLRVQYETELFERVLPFWQQHSLDEQHGGYFSCLTRTGACYDTTKYSWLQGRQAWMFSTLFRHVEQKPVWLDIAQSGIDFLRQHALRPDGRVFFSLTAKGDPIYQQRKIFSECFYVMGLAGLGHAIGDANLLDEARTGLEQIWAWSEDLSEVGRPVHEGQPESQALAIPMILLNLIEVVGDGEGETYRSEIDQCITRIKRHIHPDEQKVYEQVRPDGRLLSGANGRLLNPGHAIEAGWFMQHWALRLDDHELQQLAADVVRWSYAHGWDEKHDGLYSFLDAEGYDPVQLEWFMKLWWPHCEALYGHLLNYALTGRAADWNAFTEVHDYSFLHFPDPTYGGWYGYLDREARPTSTSKGAPYKGFFHVPRALWLCWSLLCRLEHESSFPKDP